MRRTVPVVLLISLLGAACTPLGDLHGPGTPAPTEKAPYTLAPPTPVLSAIATVAPTGHGQPYTLEMIAVELQDVSYDFPPELQSEFIAAALADRIWTYDGRPYREIWITGSCNEGMRTRCDLALSGLPAFAPTSDDVDTYWFVVHLGSPVLGPEAGHALGGLPSDLAPDIDALARSLDSEGHFEAQPLRHISWAVPPPDDAYVLTYGDDNEGDTMIAVTLDRASRRILSIVERVCCS